MRYILGLLATFGLIILILVLLLRGGDSSVTPKVFKVSDYANSTSTAHFVMDGPVVSEVNRQQVQIDVSSDQVTLTLYQGYQGDIYTKQTYANNDEAYTIFLKALQNSGFTNGNNSKALKDERGRCPNGQRRIYSFTNGSTELMRYWSTSCGPKTFEGSIGAVRTLFQAQVPDYSDQISQAKFRNF